MVRIHILLVDIVSVGHMKLSMLLLQEEVQLEPLLVG